MRVCVCVCVCVCMCVCVYVCMHECGVCMHECGVCMHECGVSVVCGYLRIDFGYSPCHNPTSLSPPPPQVSSQMIYQFTMTQLSSAST